MGTVVWWETLWPILRSLHDNVGLGDFAFPYGQSVPLSREWAIVSKEQYTELRKHFNPAYYDHVDQPAARRLFFHGVSIHNSTHAGAFTDKITTVEEARTCLLLTRWGPKAAPADRWVFLVVLGDLIYPEILDDDVLADEEMLDSLHLTEAEQWPDARMSRRFLLRKEKEEYERRRGTPEEQAEDERRRAENSDYDRDHCTDRENERPEPRNDEDHLGPKIRRRAQRKAKLVFNIPICTGPNQERYLRNLIKIERELEEGGPLTFWSGHKQILRYYVYESGEYPWDEAKWKACQRLMQRYQNLEKERADAAAQREMDAAMEEMKQEAESV
jgi:hypothetical protein